MFRITEDPSSESLVQYLAKITKKKEKWLYRVHVHTHRVTICCHNTDHVHVNGHDRTIFVILAKYCTRLSGDGSFVIRNLLEHF